MSPGGLRRRSAFTLIEILAVVAIFALIAGLVAPNIGTLGSRALREHASRVSSHLELARQRAVVTGVPHRVVLDLDGEAYWIEWLTTEAEATGLPPQPELQPEALDPYSQAPIPMAAPRSELREFRPVSGLFGKVTFLSDEIGFAGIETDSGWIGQGEASVDFAWDGTAAYSEIVMSDVDEREVVLDVLPLDDMVRIRDES